MERSRQVFALIRQTVMFVLGIIVVIDAVFKAGSHVVEIFAGLLLLGVVPLDALLERVVPVGGRIGGRKKDQTDPPEEKPQAS